MKLKTALLAGTSLLAMTAHAHAFAAIGNVVISALLAVGAGGLLPVASATAIGLGAVGIAATVAQGIATAAFLGRQPSVDPSEIKNTTQGSEGPGIYAFGRVMLGGRIAFGNTAGYDIYRLILACFGPISAVEEYFYDGRGITVDPDGSVTSPPWARADATNLFVKTKPGTGAETAWSDLTGDFPGIWTADHRVRGIGQFLVRAVNPGTGNKRFPTLFQGGLKEVQARARVGSFYDPRTASAAWTMNGVLHCLHWLRRLPGWTDNLIDFADIGTVATQGEQNVPTLAGTAPRCQLSGGWSGPLTYDIMEDMLESAGLEVVETPEGKFTFAFIEDNPASELTLEARHIISIDYQAGEEAAKRANICRLKYFSPERQYEIAEIDLTGAPWARVQDEIDRYGDHEDPIELSFCCDASQAQRIARRLFHMRRADIGLIKTTFAGIAAWGKRTITIEIPDVGEDGASVFRKVRIGAVRVNDSDGTCEIPFTVIPDILKTPWNPATMEVAPPPVLEEFEFESELDKPAAPFSAVQVQYPGGAYEVRVRIAPVAGANTAEANYRTYTGGLPDQWSSMTEPTLQLAYVVGNLTGQQVDFRVRYANSDGEVSYFSDLLEVGSLAINNSAPPAPSISIAFVVENEEAGTGYYRVTVQSSTAITAVTAEVEMVANTITYSAGGDFRPSVPAAFNLGQNLTSGSADSYRARLLSSNGTPGPWASVTL